MVLEFESRLWKLEVVCWSHNFLVHGPDVELERLHNQFISRTTSVYVTTKGV